MSDRKQSPQPRLIYRVAVPSPLRRLLDYLPPDDSMQPARIGTRLRVPFGRRQLVGLLMACATESDIPAERLRRVSAVLDDEPLFSPGMLRLLDWCIRYYHHAPGDVISTALPARLRAGEALQPRQQFWRAMGDQDAVREQLARAPRQLALWETLQARDGLFQAEVLELGYSANLLKELHGKLLVEAEERVAEPSLQEVIAATSTPPTLNEEQQQALAWIESQPAGYHCGLLDGITGSGKTEVYMRRMAAVLDEGKQCLVLVPEIGLTPQTIERFSERFSETVVALHSGMNDSERARAWRLAREGKAGIVIGTRSAIFTPLGRPGLIVVDEEHDGSFKQQEGFRYSARDLAILRGREEDVPVILGSATPSLESLHNALSGRYQHLRLRQRAGGAAAPVMSVVDTQFLGANAAFAETTELKMRRHLEAGGQVLVFINRRGYAPVLSCQDCGWIAECEACVAQMTVHRRPDRLRCHHCEKSEPLPVRCPQCQGVELAPWGLGTQKLEAMLSERFAPLPVLRVDRDSMRGKGRLSDLLKQVEAGEPCVLLGTQMLAKGHHFPAITLVVVVDADSGLFSADFRGQEHMAQTIVQVSGRAGRAERRGEVLIQSRHASHALLQSLGSESYEEFAKQLLRERRAAGLPPFGHLALLRTESRSPEEGLRLLAEAWRQASDFANRYGLEVSQLGPMPAPMERRAGRFRCQLLLRCPKRAPLQALLTALLPGLDALRLPAGLRWSLDVDPGDLI